MEREIEREKRKKPSTWRDSNPEPLDFDVGAPLLYKVIRNSKQSKASQDAWLPYFLPLADFREFQKFYYLAGIVEREM